MTQSVEMKWEGSEGLLPMAPHRSIEGANAKFLAESIEVIDRPTFDQAANVYRGLKSLKKGIEESLAPIIESAHKAHKAATALRGEMVKPIDEAAAIVKGKMETWDREQERLRKEEEELKRLAAEAEAKRQEEAARADVPELEYVMDEPGLDAGLAAGGEEWEGAGWVPVPNLSPADAAAREGIGKRRNWKVEIVDLPALLAAVAAGEFPLEWVEVRPSRIIDYVRSTDGKTPIPGVTFERVPELVIQANQG